MSTTNGAGPDGAPPLDVRDVDLERVRPFRWAWQDRLLLGYLNLLAGDEGVGKGTFLAWAIAQLTRGALPGDLADTPARVLIVGDEDGFDNVIVPRLYAAGADLTMVKELPAGDAGALDVSRDIDRLRATLVEREITVVILDQLLDNLPDGVDPHKPKQVRDALAPLRRLTHELDVCTWASLHTNKSDAGSFRQRMSGSQAFNAISRSSFLLAEHPDHEDRRVLVRGKGNYSKRPAGLEFAIEGRELEIAGHVHNPTLVVDLDESAVTLDDVLRPGVDAPHTKAAQARQHITDALADGEWHDAAPIRAELAALGHSDSGIKRAGTDLGLERRRTGGFPSGHEWRLPRARTRGNELSELTDPTGPTGNHSGPSRPSRPSQTAEPTTDLLAEADRLANKFPDLAGNG